MMRASQESIVKHAASKMGRATSNAREVVRWRVVGGGWWVVGGGWWVLGGATSNARFSWGGETLALRASCDVTCAGTSDKNHRPYACDM